MKKTNILVHSLVNLGDVLLSTSAVALLKKIKPEAKITMMVRPVARQLVENNPLIDGVIIFDYKAKGKSFAGMLKMIQTIRNKHFDMCISFDRKLRPALLCFLAGIPIRIGADRLFDDKLGKVTWFYTDVIKMPEDFFYTHQAELFQEIIRDYFSSTEHALPQIGRIKCEHREHVQNLLQDMQQGKNIALCIRGTYYSKNWPIEKFSLLIKLLAERIQLANFYIVGAPEDFEYAEELIKNSSVDIKNFCGKTNLLEYAALMEKSDLLITIDTGGMHIAATTKVPIVGIYRCVSENRWRALSDKFIAISSKRDDCPTKMKNPELCPGHYCVKDISVDEVYQAAMRLLMGEEEQ